MVEAAQFATRMVDPSPSVLRRKVRSLKISSPLASHTVGQLWKLWLQDRAADRQVAFGDAQLRVTQRLAGVQSEDPANDPVLSDVVADDEDLADAGGPAHLAG